MLNKFFPYEYAENVYLIDYEKLYEMGYRALIFDIDNTLVHHGDDSNEKVDAFFAYLHSIGFKTCLLSNNGKDRMERILKNIDSLYIANADKPKPKNYYTALDMLGVQKQEAICIGDQIFTDILGANKAGIPNILVQFIRVDYETKIGKRRYVEYMILKIYQRSKKYRHRLGEIRLESERSYNGQKTKKTVL